MHGRHWERGRTKQIDDILRSNVLTLDHNPHRWQKGKKRGAGAPEANPPAQRAAAEGAYREFQGSGRVRTKQERKKKIIF